MRTVDKKTVVYLLRSLNIGGAERYVVETAKSLDRKQFIPKIYCISEGGPLRHDAEAHGIEVSTGRILLRKPRLLDVGSKFFALCRYLRREQPDIVHCYMFTPSIYGGLAARLVSSAVIFTNRMRLGAFKERTYFFQTIENFVNRFVDRVLVNSEALKRDVLQREHLDPKKLHVVYGGVDIHHYTPVNGQPETQSFIAQQKQRLGIPKSAPVVAIVANLAEYKGYVEFMKAAAMVHHTHPEARFLCIGKDRGILHQLKELAKQLGIENRVIFTGQLQQLEQWFPIIDIQVSASHEEGFSSAIIEGMASGKPIVATRVGGNPEAVIHEETGLLVPAKNAGTLAEALTRLLNLPEWRVKLGHNGRKRVEQFFSVDKIIADLQHLYLQALDK